MHLIPFSVGITLIGIILTIKRKNINVFWVMIIYAGAALVFDLTQLVLGFLDNYWVFHLIIPFILTNRNITVNRITRTMG